MSTDTQSITINGDQRNDWRVAAAKMNAPTKNKPKCATLSALVKVMTSTFPPGIADSTVTPAHHKPNITHHMT